MPYPIDPRIQGAIRLMTASPKLLDCLKRLVIWVDHPDMPFTDLQQLVEQANAAIKEAEGDGNN